MISFSMGILKLILLQGQILGTDKFAKVIEFLRRQLHRDTLVNPLVIYVLDDLQSISFGELISSSFFCSLCMSTVHSRQTQMNW